MHKLITGQRIKSVRANVSATALALALAGWSSTAHATSFYDDVYTGTVSGYDTLALFGGGDLTGMQFTASFRDDLDAGTGDIAQSGGHQNYGGTRYGTSDPVLGTLTINGRSYTVGSTSYQGRTEIVNDPNPASLFGARGEVSDEALDYVSAGDLSTFTDLTVLVRSQVTASGFPTDLGERFNLVVDGQAVTGSGSFSINTRLGNNPFSGQQLESLQLHPTMASEPEPGAWALMMVGTGFFGAALRRARRLEALAAA